MSITILSFLSALMWSSLFVLLTYFIRKVDGMKKYYGTPLLIFLYVFGIIRIIFPLEFNFTKVIRSEKIYPFIYYRLYLNKINNMSVLFILCVIFSIVAFWKIVRFIVSYNKTINQAVKSSTLATDREYNILNEIKLSSSKNVNISILKNSYISTPIGVGLFNKMIMLPNNEYTDEELNYILLHEYTHFLNKDVFVKILTSVFCYIFWWNFIVQLLKRDLEQLLEMKCDLKVTENMNSSQKAEYLSVIVKTLKDRNENNNFENIGTTLVKNYDNEYIKERFTSVMNYNKNDKIKLTKSIALASAIAITVLSYTFILQPVYESPNGEKSLTKDNSYILKTTDGKYFLYVDDILFEEIDGDILKMFDEMGVFIKEE